MSQTFFDPNSPGLLVIPNRTSPLAPDTRRPGIDARGMFPTPPISAPQGGRVGGFFDPANPLGFPSQNPYGNTQFGADINVNTAPPGSALERYYQRMLELAPTKRQQGLADAGSLLGSFAGDQRTNRVVQGNFQGDFDRMMLDREAARNALGNQANTDFDRSSLAARADKRDANTTAMDWSQLAAHLQRGDRNTNAQTRQVSYTPASEQERAAATGLAQQAHDNLTDPGYQPTRFQGNYDYQPMDPSRYSRPGALERIGQYGGTGLGMFSALDNITGGRAGDKMAGWLGKIPGLGRLFGNGGTQSVTSASTPGAAGSIPGAGLITGAGKGIAAGAGKTAGLLTNPAFWTNPWTLGAAGAAGLGTLLWKKGIGRGGEEGVKVNPARDQFLSQFGDVGNKDVGGAGHNLAARLAQMGAGEGGGDLFQALQSANTMKEYDAAQRRINDYLGSAQGA